MNKESFVYLWYDSRNKMFYLGKHKGTPDDGYTHSSNRWQQFNSDSVPEGVKRRVLTYGSDKDMYELETKLLLNRKEKCWDRYYNASIRGKFYRPLESYMPHTEETKRKMSETHKGKKLKEYHKRKISESTLGRIVTEETRKKLSEAKLGEKNHFYGKKHTEETRKKMREDRTGEKNYFYGKKHTEESKRKMSESRLRKIPWNKGKKYTHSEKRT